MKMLEKKVERFIINLENVDYIDSSGIGALIYICSTIKKMGLKLVITNIHGSVKKVIELTKLMGYFPITPTIDEALEAGWRHRRWPSNMVDEIKEIKVDENSPLFDKTGMLHKEFPSDFRQIRYFTLLIVQTAPPEIKEINLLEQQISEIIKNAVKHGNKCDIEKKVRVWYSFSRSTPASSSRTRATGFKDMEKWNEFNHSAPDASWKQDFEKMEEFVSYRTAKSDDNDGGNALFAAVEYWDGGIRLQQEAQLRRGAEALPQAPALIGEVPVRPVSPPRSRSAPSSPPDPRPRSRRRR